MEEINVYLDLRGVPVQLKFNEKSGLSENRNDLKPNQGGNFRQKKIDSQMR